MKRFISASLSLSLLFPSQPLLAASAHGRFNQPLSGSKPSLGLALPAVPLGGQAPNAHPGSLVQGLTQAVQQTPLERLAELPSEDASGAAAAVFGEIQRPASEANPSANPLPAGTPSASGLSPASEQRAPKTPAAPQPAVAKRPPPFFHRHPRLARVIVWPVVKLLYDVLVIGRENLPDGAALLLPNHPSYVEPVLIGLILGQPARFMMWRRYYDKFWLKPLVRAAGAIPVSSEDGAGGLREAIKAGRQALEDGEKVVIFPEGGRTRDGNLMPFQRGFELMARDTSAKFVPIHVDGLWGSVFSRHPSRSIWNRLRNGRRRVTIRVGKPLETADAQTVRQAVERLAMDSRSN